VPRDDTGDFFPDVGERLVVYVADEHLRAVRRKGPREFAADAGGAGSDQNSFGHAVPSML